MTLKISELEALSIYGLKNLTKLKIESFDFSSTDFYWVVFREDMTKKGVAPTNLGVGSLQDEWEWLQDIFDDEQIAVTMDFNYLGSLTRTISYLISNGLFSSKASNQQFNKPVRVAKIQDLYEAIFKSILECRIEEVAVEHNFYWVLDIEDSYCFEKIPKPRQRKLTDDMKFLREQMKNKKMDHDTLALFFERLGSVIRLADFL
ncbi:hypothetical protein ACFLY6_00025 [Candidatus Dependentiae bacterium]